MSRVPETNSPIFLLPLKCCTTIVHLVTTTLQSLGKTQYYSYPKPWELRQALPVCHAPREAPLHSILPGEMARLHFKERLSACTPVSPERLPACKMKEEIMPDVVGERVLSKLEAGRLLNLPRWRSMFYLPWNFCLLKIWDVKQCTDNEQVSVLSWKLPVAPQTAQSGSEWGPSNPVLSYLTIERIPVSTQTQQISKRSIGPKRDNNFTRKHPEHMRGLIFLRVPWCTFFLDKIFPYWWKYSIAGTLCICSQRQKKKKNYEDTTTYLQSVDVDVCRRRSTEQIICKFCITSSRVPCWYNFCWRQF